MNLTVQNLPWHHLDSCSCFQRGKATLNIIIPTLSCSSHPSPVKPLEHNREQTERETPGNSSSCIIYYIIWTYLIALDQYEFKLNLLKTSSLDTAGLFVSSSKQTVSCVWSLICLRVPNTYDSWFLLELYPTVVPLSAFIYFL